jgi:hypothetical protein
VSYSEGGSQGVIFSRSLGKIKRTCFGGPFVFAFDCVSPVLLPGFRSSGGWQYPQNPGPGDGLRTVVGIEFAIDIARVDLDRVQ